MAMNKAQAYMNTSTTKPHGRTSGASSTPAVFAAAAAAAAAPGADLDAPQQPATPAMAAMATNAAAARLLHLSLQPGSSTGHRVPSGRHPHHAGPAPMGSPGPDGQAGSAAALMSKHGSDAGLAGVAEAAGQVLYELTPASSWRQEVLMIRLLAGLTLGLATVYALLFAPARLGWRSELALVRSFGSDNALAFVLFNLLGVYPAILACVAWPVLRSNKLKVPLWRYLAASTATGAFALLSYLAWWDPPRRSPRLPPHTLAGRTVWLQRLYEGRLWPAALLTSTLCLYSFCFIVSPATWAHLGYLATHSRTIHVMLLDFSLLTLLSPWLVIRDATARSWGPAGTPTGRVLLGLGMVVAPVIGPGVYLLLRPVSKSGGGWWVGRGTGAAAAMRRRGLKSRQQQQQASAAAASASGAASGRRGKAGRGAAGGPGGGAAAQVAAAAAVPLLSALESAAGAAAALVRDWWTASWLWVGQKVARVRGGGSPVASQDEAAGAELDVDGRDGGVSGTNTAFAAGFSSLFGHQFQQLVHQQQHQQQHSKWPLGPGPAPIPCRSPDGANELLFSDEYDEYEFDYQGGSSSDFDSDEGGLGDQAGPGWEWDSDDEDEDESGDEVGSQEDVHDEDSDEVMDEKEDELFGEQQGGAGGGGGAAADSSRGASGWEGTGHTPAASGSPHGSRPAKDAALKLLAELGQQEHPKLAAQGRLYD